MNTESLRVHESPTKRPVDRFIQKRYTDLILKFKTSEIENMDDSYRLNILAKVYSVVEIVNMSKLKFADNNHDVNSVKMSNAIQLLILNQPTIPSIGYFDIEGNIIIVGDNSVVRSICKFCKNEYPLTNLSFMKEFEGCYFNDLPRVLKNNITRSDILIYVCQPGIDPNVVLALYKDN